MLADHFDLRSYSAPFSIGCNPTLQDQFYQRISPKRRRFRDAWLSGACWFLVTSLEARQNQENLWQRQSCSIENAFSSISPNLCASKHYIEILCDTSETSSLTTAKSGLLKAVATIFCFDNCHAQL